MNQTHALMKSQLRSVFGDLNGLGGTHGIGIVGACHSVVSEVLHPGRRWRLLYVFRALRLERRRVPIVHFCEGNRVVHQHVFLDARDNRNVSYNRRGRRRNVQHTYRLYNQRVFSKRPNVDGISRHLSNV